MITRRMEDDDSRRGSPSSIADRHYPFHGARIALIISLFLLTMKDVLVGLQGFEPRTKGL